MLNQNAIDDSKGESFPLDFNLKDVTYAIEVEIMHLSMSRPKGGGGGWVGQPTGI